MSIFNSFQKLFDNDPLEEAPPRPDKASKRPKTTFFRPPTRAAKEKVEWWALKPELITDTHLFSDTDAKLAHRVTQRVNTGRIRMVKMPQAMHNCLALLAHHDLTPAHLAQFLASTPKLPSAISQYIARQTGVAAATTTPPSDAAAWENALADCDCRTVIEEMLTVFAKAMVTGGPATEWFDAQALWDHSLATALAADHLAHVYKFPRPLLVYASALLHDIGQRVVAWTLQGEMAGDDIDSDYLPSPQLVAHLCNTLHEEAGIRAARTWKLPEAIVQILGHHHQDLDPADRLAALRAIVQVADEAVLRCGHGEIEHPERKPLLDCTCATFLKLSDANAAQALGPIPGLAIQASL